MNDAHLITKIENASGRCQDPSSKPLPGFNSRLTRCISMMLDFLKWYRYLCGPYGYTMAGKTGTTETDFNPDLSATNVRLVIRWMWLSASG